EAARPAAIHRHALLRQSLLPAEPPVFLPCFSVERHIVVGVFPESEELLVRGARAGNVTREVLRPGELDSRERFQRRDADQSAVSENRLEPGGSCSAITSS